MSQDKMYSHYYQDCVIGAKGSHLDQWNRMKNSEIDPDKYAQLILKNFYLFIFGFLGLNCRVRAFSSGEHGLVVVVATTS